MLKLFAIKTPSFAYLSVAVDEAIYDKNNLLSYFYDGKKSEPTHHKEWIRVDKIPAKITYFQKMPDTNKRYELKDKSLASDKIPAVLLEKDCLNIDSDGYFCWKREYFGISSLYEEKTDKQSDVEKEIEFEIVQKIELNEEISFMGMKIPAIKAFSYKESIYDVTDKDVKYQLIDKIFFPNILLHTRPCKLTSQQSYDIVRQFIRTNIDPNVAAITSDHTFCFTVKKKIELFEPEKYQINVSPPRARKARYETRFRKCRDMEIFEMTYSPECYKGYTPIKAFEGNNLEDLQNNINIFCEELIKKINEPIADCPHCKGMGVIFK